jgi:hypothetical protein
VTTTTRTSGTTKKRAQPDDATSTDRVYRWGFGIGIAVLAVGALIAITWPTGSGSGSGSGSSPRAEQAAPPVATGDISDMGMPVVATPGSASGTTSAGGVTVENAFWAMGTVPINVAVRPDWTLRNTSSEPVTLGQPRPEVRKGCCPGALKLGTTTLAPGERTTLTFELSMHEGMDGPHDLGVHILVTAGSAREILTLGVTGDFR